VCLRLAGLMFAGIFCGHVSPQSAPLTAPEHNLKDIDRVHQGDIIDVDVVGSFEFDWRGGLNPEGFIELARRFGARGTLSKPFQIADLLAVVAMALAEGSKSPAPSK